MVSALLAALEANSAQRVESWFTQPTEAASADREARSGANAPAQSTTAGCMPLEDLARIATETLAPHRPSYLRLPLGWPGKFCHPQEHRL
jgi:hypothetical protein